MSASPSRNCLLLPCSAMEIWALPGNCLAEILTLTDVDEVPPECISWRGYDVPVLDRDPAGHTRWCYPRSRTGLVAVLLGIEGSGCSYMGVALRGAGLGLHEIPEDEAEDCPDEAMPSSLDAFRWRSVVYQVPDLITLQVQRASGGEKTLNPFVGLPESA